MSKKSGDYSIIGDTKQRELLEYMCPKCGAYKEPYDTRAAW